MQYKSYFCYMFLLLVTFLCESGFCSRYQGVFCPNIKLSNGRVKFRQRGRFAKFTCNVGYMLAGERYSICSNGAWDTAPPKCVRATCAPPPRAPPNGLIFPSHGGAVLNFYCRPGYQLRGPLVIYCDGQKWDGHLPTCFANGTKPKLICDFEDPDICGWSHDLNHDFDWRRENYQTPSGAIGTGPSFDHTMGEGKGGHYMYIETSSRNENDTARLISPVFDKTDDNTCLEFFYHMFGVTTGTLRVYLKKASDKWPLPATSAIFAKTGNQGDKWYRSFHSLGIVDEDFQIIIEGVRGPGYVSDTAIDDVKIIEDCNEGDYTTTEDLSILATSEIPPNVESCETRCGLKDLKNSSRFLISCDCDDTCVENNRCCPDYLDFCMSFESSTSEWYTTTNTPNEIFRDTSHIQESRKPERNLLHSTPIIYRTTSLTTPKITTRTTTLKTSPRTNTTTLKTTPRTTPKTTSVRPTVTSVKLTTRKTVISTKITKPPAPTTTRLQGTKINTAQRIFRVATTSNVAPRITKKPIIILQEVSTPEIVRKIIRLVESTQPPTSGIVRKIIKPTKSPKIVFVKPVKPKKGEITDNDFLNVPKFSDKNDEKLLLLTSPIPSVDEDDSSFFDKEDYAYEIVKNLDSPVHKKEWAENEKLYTDDDGENDHDKIILILSVASSVFGAVAFLGITVLLVRRNRLNQCRTRRMSSGNGDSQSDVRFLTGDETLDFSLDRDYYDDL